MDTYGVNTLIVLARPFVSRPAFSVNPVDPHCVAPRTTPFIIHRRKGADDGERRLIEYAVQSQHQQRTSEEAGQPTDRLQTGVSCADSDCSRG